MPVAIALKALTSWPTWQHFGKSKGSVEVGKLADFAILSDNPVKIDEDKLVDIRHPPGSHLSQPNEAKKYGRPPAPC